MTAPDPEPVVRQWTRECRLVPEAAVHPTDNGSAASQALRGRHDIIRNKFGTARLDNRAQGQRKWGWHAEELSSRMPGWTRHAGNQQACSAIARCTDSSLGWRAGTFHCRSAIVCGREMG
jgi:hypothetical protein